MGLYGIAKLAIGRIFATKTRSALTMLGVIIGVASLVALTSIASGATGGVNDALSGLGARQVTVSSNTATGLTEADAAAVNEIDGVEVVSSSVSGSAAAAFGDTEETLSVVGVSRTYEATEDPDIAVGRFLPTFSGDEATRSVVLSAQAANDLSITEADIGSTLTLAGQPYTIVGVLDDAGGFGFSGTAYVSMSNARKMFSQSPYVGSIVAVAASENDVSTVEQQVDSALRSRYHLSSDDSASFAVNTQTSLLSTISDVQGTLQLLLVGIASISLIVGGIGIMNIMLVSVRERTREIGVRRAIGARRRHILTQFLIEATVLSLIGGLIGLVAGIALAAVIASAAGWEFSVAGGTVVLAMGFSALVGVLFGVWPARTASRLQPIDALRFE